MINSSPQHSIKRLVRINSRLGHKISYKCPGPFKRSFKTKTKKDLCDTFFVTNLQNITCLILFAFIFFVFFDKHPGLSKNPV